MCIKELNTISVRVNDNAKEILQWLEDNTSIRWAASGDKPTDRHYYPAKGFSLDYPRMCGLSYYASTSKFPEVDLQTFKEEAKRKYPKDNLPEEVSQPIHPKQEQINKGYIKLANYKQEQEILKWPEDNTNIGWRGYDEENLTQTFHFIDYHKTIGFEANNGLTHSWQARDGDCIPLEEFKNRIKELYPREPSPEKTSQQEPIHPKEEYLGIWDCPTGICCIEWDEEKERYIYKVPQSEQMWEEYLDPIVVKGHIRDGWFTRPKPYKPGDYRNKILSRPKAKSYLSQGKSGWSSY